ncbi:hypothetical protein XENOCAPTIV_026585 [Xenoophorus captivus]|uniref:Uncharacterized protein n=1 Tax=Xenoophorus captivus TaxID=1517983 RepID=A0ABV0S387_9TELE
MEEDSVFFTDRSGRITSNPLLDQLPSYQSLLYRRKSSLTSTKRKGRLSSSGSLKHSVNTVNRLHERQKSQMEQRLIREFPLPMAEKRRSNKGNVEAPSLPGDQQWAASGGGGATLRCSVLHAGGDNSNHAGDQ